MRDITPPPVRKRLLKPEANSGHFPVGLDIAACAVLAFSSEHTTHRVENILDERTGPGGSYWSSERPDTTEELVIEFDAPQTLSRLLYEVEEAKFERTQEVRVDVSQDRGLTYRGLITQDYTFSPGGATFQREDLRLAATAVTHLRLTIVPNKNGHGTATLTSLRLYP
jgi:F5/8 type C domain